MSMDQLIDLDGTSLTNGDQSIRGRISSFSTEERLTGNFGPATVILGVNYAHDKTRENAIWATYYSTQNSFFTPLTTDVAAAPSGCQVNSEDRREGKGCVSTCRSRWSRYHT